MEKIKSFLPGRLAVIYVGASLLANVLNYAFSIVIAHGLSPEEYGGLGAAFSLIFLIAIPTIILQTHVTNEVARRTMDRKAIHSTAIRATAIGLLIAVALFGGKGFVSDWFSLKEAWISAICLQIIVSYPLSVLRGGMQGEESFGTLGTNLVLETGSKFAIGLSSLFVLHGNATLLLWCISCSVCLALWHAIWSESRKPHAIPTEAAEKEEGIYQFLATFAVVASLIFYANADVLLVRNLAPAASHDYLALSRLAQIIPLAANIIISLFLPKYARLYREKQDTKTVFFSAYAIILAGIALSGIIFWLWSEWLVVRMFGNAYGQSASVLIWFWLGTSLLALSQLSAFYLVSVRQRWITAILPLPAIAYAWFVHFSTGPLNVEWFCRSYAYSMVTLFLASCASLVAFRVFRSLQAQDLKS